MGKIRELIPNAIFEMDNRRQVVIYTGLFFITQTLPTLLTKSRSKVMNNDWIKLEKANDGGFIYYRIPGAWQFANKGGQKVLHTFRQIEIRWPDGTVEVVDVTTKTILNATYDMGYPDSVRSFLPVFSSKHHEVEILVEFQQVEIRRRCLKGPGLSGPPDDDPDEKSASA